MLSVEAYKLQVICLRKSLSRTITVMSQLSVGVNPNSVTIMSMFFACLVLSSAIGQGDPLLCYEDGV
jgi:hypothetical protein